MVSGRQPLFQVSRLGGKERGKRGNRVLFIVSSSSPTQPLSHPRSLHWFHYCWSEYVLEPAWRQYAGLTPTNFSILRIFTSYLSWGIVGWVRLSLTLSHPCAQVPSWLCKQTNIQTKIGFGKVSLFVFAGAWIQTGIEVKPILVVWFVFTVHILIIYCWKQSPMMLRLHLGSFVFVFNLVSRLFII